MTVSSTIREALADPKLVEAIAREWCEREGVDPETKAVLTWKGDRPMWGQKWQTYIEEIDILLTCPALHAAVKTLLAQERERCAKEADGRYNGDVIAAAIRSLKP